MKGHLRQEEHFTDFLHKFTDKSNTAYHTEASWQGSSTKSCPSGDPGTETVVILVTLQRRTDFAGLLARRETSIRSMAEGPSRTDSWL